jgi:broad specificity phosphatase PhoE
VLAEMRDRVIPAFDRIVHRHRDETVAIVAHGGVNRAIILTALGCPLSSFWRIRQDNAGINLLEFEGDRGRLVTMNETWHLKP